MASRKRSDRKQSERRPANQVDIPWRLVFLDAFDSKTTRCIVTTVGLLIFQAQPLVRHLFEILEMITA